MLDDFLNSVVDVPRVKHGDRQSINSLINEEVKLLGKYFRDEITKWTPRVVVI